MYSGKVSLAQCRANEDALAVILYTSDKNPTRHSIGIHRYWINVILLYCNRVISGGTREIEFNCRH